MEVLFALILLQGKRAIQVTEWPHHIQRMQNKGQEKKSLLANEDDIDIRDLYKFPNPSPSECKLASLPHNARKNKFRNT